jgi:hypothetical protein
MDSNELTSSNSNRERAVFVFDYPYRDSLEDFQEIKDTLVKVFSAEIHSRLDGPYSTILGVRVRGIAINLIIDDGSYGMFFYAENASDQKIAAKLAADLEKVLQIPVVRHCS